MPGRCPCACRGSQANVHLACLETWHAAEGRWDVVGAAVGRGVGRELGDAVGAAVGEPEGAAVVGSGVGVADGAADDDGADDGEAEGKPFAFEAGKPLDGAEPKHRG